MQVNTKTGKLKLLRREEKILCEAATILQGIEKHGDGRVKEYAAHAVDEIDGVFGALNPLPEEKAIADAEEADVGLPQAAEACCDTEASACI